MEAGDEVLQVLQVCEAVQELRAVIVTNVDGDSMSSSPPGAGAGAGAKPSQVRAEGSNTRRRAPSGTTEVVKPGRSSGGNFHFAGAKHFYKYTIK
ncbi:hypothetical protein EYF80_064715 [Liparis tanakae]|uniref:Uncharacterized protein n=1 Tax=Liparis tanakae TaxID=230148 RepID=A0A4Z2E8M0_9TELE|nr:hypothetical protein EYF80_064715 [Liparis tanakae]